VLGSLARTLTDVLEDAAHWMVHLTGRVGGCENYDEHQDGSCDEVDDAQYHSLDEAEGDGTWPRLVSKCRFDVQFLTKLPQSASPTVGTSTRLGSNAQVNRPGGDGRDACRPQPPRGATQEHFTRRRSDTDEDRRV
jgi:hypothetical protein